MRDIPMERVPNSSQLWAWGYDPGTKTARVQFIKKVDGKPTPGDVYKCFPMPEHAWLSWLKADSPGAHFNQKVKSFCTVKKVTEENG